MRNPDHMTPEVVGDLLRYEPETGHFYWRKNRRGMAKAGMRAGSINSGGYVMIAFLGHPYTAHKLAWILYYGSEPKYITPGRGGIDHINGDKADNRICNLRLATNSQNQANQRKSRSSCGFKGVAKSSPNRWEAKIRVNGKRIYLGNSPTPEGAHELYRQAAIKFFGEFAA
jgi:hypothetical protein